MKNDLNISEIDKLGELLAQIKDLTEQADKITDEIKEAGADGLLAVDDEGVRFVEGSLFRAVYIESNQSRFDSKKFIAKFGADVYAEYTKTSAYFSVKVTAR